MYCVAARIDSARNWLRRVLGWSALLLVWCCSPNMASGDWQDDVGYTELVSILGASAPNGAGVPISMSESPDMSGAYFPDTSHSQFDAPTDPLVTAVNFIDGSGGQGNGTTNHALGMAFFFFGNVTSVAPAANQVTVYEANDYLEHVLKVEPSYGNSDLPLAQDFRVQNFSWIGTFADDPDNPTTAELKKDREALRRFDFTIDRDNITAFVGVSDNTTVDPMPHLLGHSYNAIAVGRSDGVHADGLTILASYGTGRSKPDLVSPQLSTSRSSASTSSVATFLHSSATVLNTDAAESETMKAILLAGATKNEFATWSQLDAGSQWHPLDDTYGAGEVNVLNSYLMTVGGQAAGNTTVPGTVPRHGWDYQTVQPGPTNKLLYDFVVPAGSTAKELSIALTWNAQFSASFNTGDPVVDNLVANLDLELVDSGGSTVDLIAGNGYDEGLSVSTVDNVEHIYLTDLPAGTYTLKVSSDDTARDFGLAWRMSTFAPTADFDDSGTVDGADFLAWQQGFGTSVLDPLGIGDADGDSDIDELDLLSFALTGELTNAARGIGDADGDGDVDADDLAIFTAGYGTVVPTLHTLHNLAFAVPEPSSVLLASLGLFSLYCLRRPRNSR